jgi:hypothetical protein
MSQPPTVFLLSPAYCGGRRAAILLKPGSMVALAQRLQAGTLTLGEAFSFMSGLYFRGKLTYATAFARPARAGDIGVGIITPTRGLQPPDTLVSVERIREFASVDVSEHDARYRAPLERDLAALARQLPETARVVLLGSVATGKYVEILAAGLGARLHYPPAFIGRGDMSRGGLLLRSAAAGTELEYAALDPGARRRGARPPKLGPLPRGERRRYDERRGQNSELKT